MATKFVKSEKLTRAERLRRKTGERSSQFVEKANDYDEEDEIFEPKVETKNKVTPNQRGSSVFARPNPNADVHKSSPKLIQRKPGQNRPKGLTASKRIVMPLNKQGAEIQFSTQAITRFGWRTASALLLVGCLAALIFLSQQKIEHLQFIGVQDSLANDIENVLNLNGTAIYTIDPGLIATKMDNAFPKLTDVKIKIQLPAKVIVSAKERTPLYAWKMDNFVYLIDNENLIYPASPNEDTSGLITITADLLPPEVSIVESSNDIISDIMKDLYPSRYDEEELEQTVSHKNTYTVDGNTIATLKQLIAYLPDNNTLMYSKEHGFGWQTTQGWTTYFGTDLENMNMKLAIVYAIEQNLVLNNIEATLISVEYLHAPYFREE